MQENRRRAFLWTSERGKKSAQDFLIQKGELLPGWAFTQATKTTRNGRVLVGVGEYKATPDSILQKRASRVFLGGRDCTLDLIPCRKRLGSREIPRLNVRMDPRTE